MTQKTTQAPFPPRFRATSKPAGKLKAKQDGARMLAHPITVLFAWQVGAFMAEIADECEIYPLYRLYM